MVTSVVRRLVVAKWNAFGITWVTMSIKITDQNFDTEVIKETLPVMVDFWAEWCGPCKMAEPVIEELASTYVDKVKVGKLNVDENTAVAAKYGVMSIPTVILFKDGAEVARQVGYAGKAGYEQLVAKASV